MIQILDRREIRFYILEWYKTIQYLDVDSTF